MSVRPAARATGPWSAAAWRRHSALAFALLVAALPFTFTPSSGVRADRPAPVRELAPEPADRAGLALRVERHRIDGESLIEVALPPPPVAEGAWPASARLLDVTEDGSRIAATDQVAGASATLAIGRADGGVLLRDLPGILAGTFSPDGSALAIIDGLGRLWSLDAGTGQGDVAADGPFSAPVVFEPRGTLLLRAVSSVAAPFQARLVRYDPVSGSFSQLSGDELVYSAHQLTDGSIAYSAHQPGGGTHVKRIAAGGEVTLLADLGPDAIDVDVTADGSRIAYAIVGDGVYVIDAPGARPRRVGDGEGPRFSPGGDRLLVRFDRGARVLALDGSILAELAEPSATWLDCQEECVP